MRHWWIGLWACVACAQIKLVENGGSRYTICTEDPASAHQQRAAAELQRFVAQMSGAKLPVSPCAESATHQVRIRERDGLGEASSIEISGSGLIIEGGRDRGVLNGVYSLLDQLGCRWFTRTVSHIPNRRTIVIPKTRQQFRPAFEYRDVYFTEARDPEWSARNRLNGQHVIYHPFVHSFPAIIPHEQYFASHPEYFALVDGQRRWERAQICLTNPDVMRIAVDRTRQWIRERPDSKFVSISQNDWTGYCECDRCRRVEAEEGGAHSGPLVRFVNHVAEQIEREHPDKKIDTLAYWYTEPPPTKTRPHKNVWIRFAPIRACQSHPYESCPYNARVTGNLRRWSEITNRIYVWHYSTNFEHYLLPFPNFKELAADVPMYRRHGVTGIFMQGSPAPGGGGEFAELRSYVLARLLWNPDANVEAEINSFLAAVFGSAAKSVRAYFDLVQRQGRANHLWVYDPADSPYVHTRFLDQADAILRRAASQAVSPEIRERVERVRLGIDYAKLRRRQQFFLEGDWFQPRGLDALRTDFNRFFDRIRELGIEHVREGVPPEMERAMFDQGTRPFRTVTLSSASTRAIAIPELNSRVIELGAYRVGIDPGSWRYPDQSGIWPQAHASAHHRVPYQFTWADVVDRGPAGEVAISGASPDDLIITRKMRLDGGRLETVTEVHNVGETSRPVTIQAIAELRLDPGANGEQLALAYRTVSGTQVDRTFFEPRGETGRSGFLRGDNLPAGVWHAYGPAGTPGIEHSFEINEVDRCDWAWTLRGVPTLAISCWSKPVTLEPARRVMLKSHYRATSGRGGKPSGR